MNQVRYKYYVYILGLSISAFAGFTLSLFIGPAEITSQDLLNIAAGTAPKGIYLIFTEIRLPRSVLAAAVGATLGLSGAALQGYLRNPLAEPGIIGVTSTAALFSVLTFYTGLGTSLALMIPIGGIIGAMFAVTLIHLLAGKDFNALTLILAGVAITSFSGAMLSLALNLSPNPFATYEVIFWMLGSLADKGFDQVALALPFMIVGWIFLFSTGNSLDALTLGEEEAISLGFDLLKIRTKIVIGTALSVGAATSICGAIGFVGLVVPHLLRPLVQSQPKLLLPLSTLGGATLVLFADILVRLLPFDTEIKLGVITALVGAPFFLVLLLKHRERPL
jgi:iron complex transport system permease protein